MSLLCMSLQILFLRLLAYGRILLKKKIIQGERFEGVFMGIECKKKKRDKRVFS